MTKLNHPLLTSFVPPPPFCFSEELIDEDTFRALDNTLIAELIPRIGLRVKFCVQHKTLYHVSDGLCLFQVQEGDQQGR